jgi:hypothetical protein
MKTKSILLSTAFLFAFTAACGSNGREVVAIVTGPKVESNVPVENATGVPVNASVSATFSERMRQDTLNNTTFTLVAVTGAIPVPGTVIYSSRTATFWPTLRLNADSTYTATVTTGAQNAYGIALREGRSWRFTTGNTVQPGPTVDLGTAGGFAILAKAAISTVPASAITGDVGISPAAASFITGFALVMDASNQFSTSSQVTGSVFAADYSAPTPANMTAAVLDMETAFTDAASRAPDVTELGAGIIGGLTLAPGVYKWGTGVSIPTNVTLNGSATDVWIFQIAQTLTVSSATSVILTGGAQPKNVFWQVSGLVDLNTTSSLQGNILGATSIHLRTGASVNGRLLAQTAITLDTATVAQPVQ